MGTPLKTNLHLYRELFGHARLLFTGKILVERAVQRTRSARRSVRAKQRNRKQWCEASLDDVGNRYRSLYGHYHEASLQ